MSQPVATAPHICIDPEGDSILTLHNNASSQTPPAATYLVSSLTLQSTTSYFSAIFTHSFAESVPRPDGKYRFSASGFSPEALHHALLALHAPLCSSARTELEKLPRIQSAKLLVAISDVVGYYQVSALEREIVDGWFAHWRGAEGEWKRLPKRHGERLMMWLALGERFGIKELCDKVAGIVVQTGRAPFESFGWEVRRETLGLLEEEHRRVVEEKRARRARKKEQWEEVLLTECRSRWCWGCYFYRPLEYHRIRNGG
ncbi:hypothetical protein SVAN01_00029 [Stagonosporopsis vannaccii]|nr:hypothetical protein SVAN01_00029 [Stagonosporopsis vannaccii]